MKMKIVVKNVNEKPEIKDIYAGPKSLKNLQDLVGGYIELVHLPENIIMVCNEEGKMMNLPVNFVLRGDRIAGNVIFLSSDNDGEFIGLTEVQSTEVLNWFNTNMYNHNK